MLRMAVVVPLLSILLGQSAKHPGQPNGLVWWDGDAFSAIGQGSSSQCLLSNVSSAPTWGSCSGGAGGYATVDDEGSALTARTVVNFIGGAVTCVDNAGATRTDCTITGGYSTIQEEGTNLTQRSTFNFIGPAITAVDNAGATKTDVTVVASGTGACGASTWASTLNNGAAPTCTQPGFSNIAGTATDAQLANAYSGTGSCTAGRAAVTLNRNAAPTCTSFYSTVDEEGSALAPEPVLNFQGAGITCADDGTLPRTNCIVPGPVAYDLDFGAVARLSAYATVTDATVTATSKIMAVQSGIAATGRPSDEPEMDSFACRAIPAAGSFKLVCSSLEGATHGLHRINYTVL